MKIRDRETGSVENVKIFKCEDCGAMVVRIGEEELNSTELFASDYDIIEIDRTEFPIFNEFMEDTRVMLKTCWEYYEGRLDAAGLFDEEEGDPHDKKD